MKKEEIIALLEGYRAGTLSQEEETAFLQWYSQTDLDEFHVLLAQSGTQPQFPAMPADFRTRMEKALRGQDEDNAAVLAPVRSIPYFKGVFRWTAAAAILIAIATGGYFLFQHPGSGQDHIAQQQRYRNDVSPGRTGAILTLAGGKHILLDSAASGQVGVQGATSIINTNGELSYIGSKEKPTDILYNTLTTGRGNQYALVLPDGTKVWLNAASSIYYPTAFTGNERKVRITGEAYFEVAKNANAAFIVQKNDLTVEVLGTHFNINTYEDEHALKTTLLEGSVRIKKTGNSVLLTPGRQAITDDAKGGIRVDSTVRLDEVMAWKNGSFMFQEATIESIMRQLSRWYDVEVTYDTHISQHFLADIPRDVPISEILKLLELTGQVHFKIDGKKLTVMP